MEWPTAPDELDAGATGEAAISKKMKIELSDNDDGEAPTLMDTATYQDQELKKRVAMIEIEEEEEAQIPYHHAAMLYEGDDGKGGQKRSVGIELNRGEKDDAPAFPPARAAPAAIAANWGQQISSSSAFQSNQNQRTKAPIPPSPQMPPSWHA